MGIISSSTWSIPQPAPIVVAIVMVLIALWAIIDAATRPAPAFEQAGQKKTTWLLLLIVTSIMCGPIGTVIATYYLVGLRPKVGAA